MPGRYAPAVFQVRFQRRFFKRRLTAMRDMLSAYRNSTQVPANNLNVQLMVSGGRLAAGQGGDTGLRFAGCFRGYRRGFPFFPPEKSGKACRRFKIFFHILNGLAARTGTVSGVRFGIRFPAV
jgi:hypothetical protein